MNRPIETASRSLLGRMRFPQLFLLFGALFVADLFIPDMVPFIDEFMLLLLTVMTGLWKRERGSSNGAGDDAKPPEKNVTP